MRARIFDPRTGTFLQRDPFGYEDSVNLYAGLANNPINRRDPTGMQSYDQSRYVDNFVEASYRPSYRGEGGNLSKWITLTYADGTALDFNLDNLPQMSVDVRQAISNFEIYEGDLGRQYPNQFNEVTTPALYKAASAARQAMNQYAFECLVDASTIVVLPLVLGPEIGTVRDVVGLNYRYANPRPTREWRSVGADFDPNAAAANARGMLVEDMGEGFRLITKMTEKGEVQVLAQVAKDGEQLTLSGLEIEGPGAASLGPRAMREFARELGRLERVKTVVVHGAKRTTGANPGHTPRPIVIKVE